MDKKQTKLLFEGWRNFLKEEATADKIDSKLFPTKLSQAKANAGVSIAAAQTGIKDGTAPQDDVATTKDNASFACNKLMPGQTTMDLDKFIGMSIQMFLKIGGFPGGPGGDLGAIISQDFRIMDGHHRWAGSLLVNPNSQVSGLMINIPAQKLVGILNVWTVAHGGAGKTSTHTIKEITGDVISKRMIELCKSGLTGGKSPISAEQLAAAAKKQNITFEQMAATAKKNWDSYNPASKLESWMPTKIDMPAIEPEQLAQVKADIESGKMDINPPYSKAVKDQAAKKNIKVDTTQPAQAAQPTQPAKSAIKESVFRQQIKKIVLQELRKLK